MGRVDSPQGWTGGEMRAGARRPRLNAVSPPVCRFASDTLAIKGRERSGGLFDLVVFELDGGGAAEDRDGDAQAGAFLVDLFHRAVEAGERAVGDAHLLADLELDGGLGPFHAFFD